MRHSEEALRDLPAVNSLAVELDADDLTDVERIAVARSAIAIARERILAGDLEVDVRSISAGLSRAAVVGRAKRMINATGVILHTNLGRSPLSSDAAASAHEIGASYSNTELNLTTGERGNRGSDTRWLLRVLTGAEDALVVNNNAAALFIVLSALAGNRHVPVSRGELIEIGGSYRLPEVMRASGARLVEVGTTNKTRVGDYTTALQIHDCALVLRVHRANFELNGFVDEPAIAELAAAAAEFSRPLVFDVGSGLLDATTPWLESTPGWLHGEPGVTQALSDGADLVTFSGDKLLGGPQSGIIVGKSELVEKLRDHALRRVLRVDAATDAALATTLRSYVEGDAAQLPFWRMATLEFDALEERATAMASSPDARVELGHSMVGAGSAPGARIDSPLLRLAGAQKVFGRLLELEIPILARRDRGDLVIDLRTVAPGDDPYVADSLAQCL